MCAHALSIVEENEAKGRHTPNLMAALLKLQSKVVKRQGGLRKVVRAWVSWLADFHLAEGFFAGVVLLCEGGGGGGGGLSCPEQHVSTSETGQLPCSIVMEN